MFGFQKIVEERIRSAQRNGDFDSLSGSGKPLNPVDDSFVPEELRLAYKILKNADCVPPEIEIKREIHRIEELVAQTEGTVEKLKLIKRLNLLIMKFNLSRNSSVRFEMPQRYQEKLMERWDKPPGGGQETRHKDGGQG